MLLPKYPAAGNSIFSTMTALANEHKAINLAQGFPDFPIDPLLSQLVEKAISAGYNQYAPMAGLPALRTAIAEKISHFQQVTIDAEQEITITPGATYGIYTALNTILEKGDEVIVVEPAYDSYVPGIYMCGGIPVGVALNDDGFTMNWQKVEDALTSRTKAIIINNPHNPCGSIWQEEDMRQLARIIERTNLYVVADEVYEHMVFDGAQHISVLRYESLRRRSFVIYSFGKSLHCTGWKMGYCIAPPDLTQAFRQIHQYLCFSVNAPMQQAIAVYIQELNRFSEVTLLLENRRNSFLNAMIPTGFTFKAPAQGSYFQVMDYSSISDLPDLEFAAWLTREYGVATIPLSPFYSTEANKKRCVRFCFAKKTETLLAAAEKLRKI